MIINNDHKIEISHGHLGLVFFTLNSLRDSGDMVHIFEDGTKLKVP